MEKDSVFAWKSKLYSGYLMNLSVYIIQVLMCAHVKLPVDI